MIKKSMLLSILLEGVCCFSYSIDTTYLNSFQESWDSFIQSNDFDRNKIGTDYEYEFFLLDEFSELQASRYRPSENWMDRYDNCRPYFENKITLSSGIEMSASFICLSHLKNGYQDFIATQAPFKQSIKYFWQMIKEQQIDQIVMVTELFDITEPNRKLADPYWPEKIGESFIFENGLKVTLVEENALLSDRIEYIQIRKFTLLDHQQEKIVTHYWYRNWPDDTAPSQAETILTLINVVESQKINEAPILVHCSAGVGRTGVFITLYHFMQRAKLQDQKISLFDFAGYLRWQRYWLVAMPSQYKFCYDVHSQFK